MVALTGRAVMERTRTKARGDRSLIDRARVNINEEREVKYRTATFSCTKAQLVAAIAAVGTKPEWVRAHLKRVKVIGA